MTILILGAQDPHDTEQVPAGVAERHDMDVAPSTNLDPSGLCPGTRERGHGLETCIVVADRRGVNVGGGGKRLRRRGALARVKRPPGDGGRR